MIVPLVVVWRAAGSVGPGCGGLVPVDGDAWARAAAAGVFAPGAPYPAPFCMGGALPGPLSGGDGWGVVDEPVVTGAADSAAGGSGRAGVTEPLAGAPLVALRNPPCASAVVVRCLWEVRFGSRDREPPSMGPAVCVGSTAGRSPSRPAESAAPAPSPEPRPSADEEPLPSPEGDADATLGAVVAATVRAVAAPADAPHSNVVAIPITPKK